MSFQQRWIFMGLRPSRTVRNPKSKQVWARISKKKPRKSYIKGAPRPKVRQYHMGADKYYEIEVDMLCGRDIALRDNAIEAARQAANKRLERELMPTNYYLTVLKYPHVVVREHSALGVAGADRISKGMKKAFGAPKGRLLHVHAGEAVFRARATAKALPVIKKAFDMAMRKLSGVYTLKVRDITKDPANMIKSRTAAVVFKRKETAEEKKKAEEAAAAAAAAAAAGAATAAPAEGEEKAAAPAAADAKKPPAGKK
jgi:large subunit ribosomal protein L10e